MCVAVIFRTKCLATNFTSVRFVPAMRHHMLLIMFRIYKCGVTHRTTEWSLACVNATDVVVQQTTTLETLQVYNL